MCRLTAYFGLRPICAADLVTRPTRSIVLQSYASRERIVGDGWTPGYLNADGFGLAWYHNDLAEDRKPTAYKSTRPAFNDPNLASLCEKILASVLFVHVRAASAGMDVSENSCHPFIHGNLLFMHNGAVADFFKIRRRLLPLFTDPAAFEMAMAHGTSDSAWCFALFLQQLNGRSTQELGSDAVRLLLERSIAVLADILDEENVREPSLLNFALTDGEALWATRYTINPEDPGSGPLATLYWGSGTKYSDPTHTGNYCMIHADRTHDVFILSSEPLSAESSDWTAVPPNSSLVVTSNLDILFCPIPLSFEPVLPTSPLSLSSPAATRQVSRALENLGRATDRPAPVTLTTTVSSPDSTTMATKYRVHIGDPVLAMANNGQFMFLGTQGGDIVVWDLTEQKLSHRRHGHARGVMALQVLNQEGIHLVSASVDNSVGFWSIQDGGSLEPRATVPGECFRDGGAYCVDAIDQFVYVGFRGMSVLQIDTSQLGNCPKSNKPGSRVLTRFGPGKRSHNGFVCSLVSCSRGRKHVDDRPFVVTGCADSLIRIFDPEKDECVRALEGHQGAVMALQSTDQYLFSGSRDGSTKVWEIDAEFSCRRTLRHGGVVLSIAVANDLLMAGSEDGCIRIWSVTRWLPVCQLQCDPVQALSVCLEHKLLFAGTSGECFTAWDLEAISRVAGKEGADSNAEVTPAGERILSSEQTLSDWLRFRTLSADPKYREDCWEGAKFISSLLEELGARVKMVTTPAEVGAECNPVVLARFAAVEESAPTVAFYGHYDVMPATSEEWSSDPWELTTLDGYYYGRGVADNKGPIVSLIFAVHELSQELHGRFQANVVLAIEGQGEAKNEGFREIISQNSHWFDNTVLLLKTNSYWVDDDRPCLTYGMRGLLELVVRVTGGKQNLHSGFDGGGIRFEPMADLIGIVSELEGNGVCVVPGFLDDVQAVKPGIPGQRNDFDTAVFESRWAQPSLSVTSVESSNSTGAFSVIPSAVWAKVSVRFVPEQRWERLAEVIRAHLEYEFRKRRSSNTLEVEVVNVGDYWLESPCAEAFQAAATAIREVWGQEPLYVREGGTLSTTAWLKAALGCAVVHIPLAGASANAHLPNERIRVRNMDLGCQVLKQVLRRYVAPN